MTNEEVLKNQIIISTFRAYQATSVARAILLSEDPINPLFTHIENTQYFTIVGDVNKLFDKAGKNLFSLFGVYKPLIKNTEYEELLGKAKTIEDHHKKIIDQIKLHRDKIGSHIDIAWVFRMANEPASLEGGVGLVEIQDLLKDLIDLLKSASFVNEEEKEYLSARIDPMDAQRILGLKMKDSILRDGLKEFFSN